MTEVELFTAAAASIGALGGLAHLVEVWRERDGISVKPKVSFLATGSLLTGQIAVKVFSRRRPVTISGAGILFPEVGALTATFDDVKLQEGEGHSFNVPLGKCRELYKEFPELGDPVYAYAEAMGRVYRGRLGWNEIAHITGNSPRGLRWKVLAVRGWLPPWGRKRRRAIRKKLAEKMKSGAVA
jgi:hypothetical protein